MLNEKIENLCKLHGISIQGLEKKLNIGNGIIGKWKITKSPSITTIAKIADYFNVSIDYLMGRVIDKNAPPPPELKEVNPLLLKLYELPSKDKKTVENYIDVITTYNNYAARKDKHLERIIELVKDIGEFDKEQIIAYIEGYLNVDTAKHMDKIKEILSRETNRK